jgi:hypothetical protein
VQISIAHWRQSSHGPVPYFNEATHTK